MNSHDKEWWQQQSGEYVLGTLSHEDRLVIETITRTEPDVSAMIVQWQERLQPLNDDLQMVKPPAHIWQSIRASIDIDAIVSGNTPSATQLSPDLESGDIANFSAPAPGAAGTNDSFEPMHVDRARYRKLGKKVDLWRSVAGLAMAACLLMTLFAGVYLKQSGESENDPATTGTAPDVVETSGEEQQTLTDDTPYVADTISIVKGLGTEVLWVLETDKSAARINMTSLVPPALPAGKAYQLWMVNPGNTGLISVAVLGSEAIKRRILDMPQEGEKAVAFAVTMEPAGGSPDPGPTGAVLYQGVIRDLGY